MSQVIDLCEGDSGGDGGSPNTAFVPPPPVSRKRPRDKEESSNDEHPRKENGYGDKTATDSEEFVVDRELAYEVEVSVSPHKKRRGVVKSEQSAENDAAENLAQMLEEVHDTEKDGGGEDSEVANHREFHEGIASAATASHPMNSNSEQTSRDDGSTNKHSQKRSTSKPPSNASGWQRESMSAAAVTGGTTQQIVKEEDITANTSLGRESPIDIYDSDDSSEEKDALPYQATDWSKKFKELCEYRQSMGQCTFHCQDPEYAELSKWVFSQRREYRRMVGGKDSILTPERVKTLEGIGFVWIESSHASWENRLTELADYRKIHGHCNVPQNSSENTKLAKWVKTQRYQYKLHLEGKSPMTTLRVQELESVGFEWHINGAVTAWEVRLSELANYRKIHGHCNVPRSYSENTKLANWVAYQRLNYKLRVEGKTSYMTVSRIQELESLSFEWGLNVSACEDRLSELADYREIHGHCNVPTSYSENTKLANWVSSQRCQYKLHREGKTSPMTTLRVQELESVGFEWHINGAVTAWEVRLSELADYRKIHGHCNVPKSYSENTKLHNWVFNQRKQYNWFREGKRSPMTTFRIQALESLAFEWNCSGATWEDRKCDSHSTTWKKRLSELADYREIHGHCNVPRSYSENTKLANWVPNQKTQYRWYREGKTSSMTTLRIQALESLSFDWEGHSATWEDRNSTTWKNRLSEVADYREIHGHCNVPRNYSTKLHNWVSNQRKQYNWFREGKRSPMTTFRIQALESLSFDWKPSSGWVKGTPKKPSVDDHATCVRERAVDAPEHVQTTAQIQREIPSNQVDVAFVAEESDWNDEVHLAYIPGRTEEI
jgi:hypothetical protein